MRKRDFEQLVAGLEAEDAFSRLDAEKRLRDLLMRDFGYRWDGTAETRKEALARLRAHDEAERKRERTRRAEAAAPGLAAVDLSKLKGMTPQQVEHHLQKLLGKAGLLGGFQVARPRCQGCQQRPATVEIVEVDARTARSVTRLCDPCAAQRGEVR